MKIFVSIVFACFALSVSGPGLAQPETPIDFGPPEALVVDTQNGPVTFQVELADTFEERARGLMFRESLADDHGMLFHFTPPRQVNIWMKNTFISLDVIFVDDKGKVISIARNARPKSLRHIPSGGKAAGVLEIAAGRARALGIERGDSLHHRFFGTAINNSIKGIKTPPGAHGDLPEARLTLKSANQVGE